MTQETPPIEETPVVTDAQRIVDLEAELAAANEVIARQQDTIRSSAAQKSAEDATLSTQAATITDLNERVIPELNARHAQEIAGRDAKIAAVIQLLADVVLLVLRNPKYVSAIPGDVMARLMGSDDVRTLVAATLAGGSAAE